MTPVRLNDILKNPHSVSEKEIETLETLVSEFPYFNLPHILLAKTYKQNEDYKYDKQVKKASLRVIDREWLFEFITNKASTKPSDNIQFRDEIKETDTFSKTVRSPAFEPTEEAVAPKSEEKTNIESEPIAETESKETILETDSLTEKDKIEEDSVPLNQEKIHLEENNEAGTIETTLGTEAQPVFNDNKIETHSFSEWLQQISKTPHLKVGDNQHKTTIEQTPTQFNHSIHKSKPEDFIAIIDSFLKNQPTISHPKSEFFKAEKAAMRSLELDDDIVTETLASIYVKQGHKEEAIWAYEKLKLKFPEKESYFAALINELKKDTE